MTEATGRTEAGGMTEASGQVVVGIVMGSRSDWATMEHAAQALEALGVGYEAEVVSAHRTPERMFGYAREARGRGLRVKSKALHGLDSLLSIVQMPGGVPTATFAIGPAGAKNAGLFAAAMLALGDAALAERLDAHRSAQTEAVLREADPRA
jgi:5-(carboxyamino)imidazole ribonucleotide mutase